MPPATAASKPLAEIARAFPLLGQFDSAVPYGSGHINDTFVVTFDQAGRPVRYILQRINGRVFRNIPALMENIGRVSRHATQRAGERGLRDATRRALSLVPTRAGQTYHQDEDGGCWRCYLFIEGARTYDLIEGPAQAAAAARAFGDFQGLLLDLPGERLHETIPHFHHTRRRFDTFRAVVEADPQGRVAAGRAEVDFALAHEPIVDVLLGLHADGQMPERITHNDAKLNNVMLDAATSEGVCVIDLDTVMPGLALYDFGDMVRSATNAAVEDEPDLNRVHCRLPIFDALVEGYLASARSFLTPAEVAHLAFAGRLITFEIGLRFLSDFLEGNVYFKTRHPGHNLDRARNQFALVRNMEEQQAEMERIVARHAGG